MGAAVEQHVHAAIAMPGHDHGLAAEFRGEVVAGLRHLAGVADVKPGAGEDALHLQFENVGIGVDVAVHPPRLDQLGDVLGASVAHWRDSDNDLWIVMAGLGPPFTSLSQQESRGCPGQAGQARA